MNNIFQLVCATQYLAYFWISIIKVKTVIKQHKYRAAYINNGNTIEIIF